MNKKIIILAIVLIIGGLPGYVRAGIISTGIREITEAVTKTGAKKASMELSEFGGRKALKKVLEKAAVAGGDEAVERVVYYGREFGLDAIRVIDRAPVKYIKALDGLPADRVQASLWAVSRNPVVMDDLVRKYGSDALLMASRHRGIGTDLMMKLGRDSIRIGEKISENQAIILARHADEITGLAPARRTKVLEAIYKAPGKMIGFLEKHPKTLRTAAGVAAFLSLKEDIFGSQTKTQKNPDGSESTVIKGLVERIITLFLSPLNLILYIFSAIITAWGVIRLWGVFRREQRRSA